jgi:hypothetical protein
MGVKMRTATLLLALAALPCAAQVKITPGPGKISVEIAGKPFTDFYVAGPEVTKPYLHPLRSATGIRVTRAWPMENAPDEAKSQKDHPHQRGVWFAHESVNGLDFWNNEASYTTPKRGKITLVKTGAIKSGKDKGSIAATFNWTDMKGDALYATESRVMTFYSDPKLRTVDFDITLTAAQDLTFGDNKDGSFAVRLRPVLQEEAQKNDAFPVTGHIVNAEGLATEKAAWGKQSDWCDYFGEVEGQKLGIAILDHPANPRHQPRWHVRGYGLFADNPFGLSVFTNDKTQNGALKLEKGKSLRFRYRVVIHPGDAKEAGIAELWKKYAAVK